MNSRSWPTRQPGQAIPVLVHKTTPTHTIDYTADGVLSIQRNGLRDISQDPVIMQETEGMANYNVLNNEVIDALIAVLATARSHTS